MPFIVGTILILVSISGKDLSKLVLRNYLYYVVCVLGWQVTDSLYYIFNVPATMELVANLSFAFASLASVLLLRVIVGFYKLDKKLPNRLSWIMLIIPIFTGVLAVSGLSDNLVLTGFEVTATYPLSMADFDYGIWYYVNSIYSNLIILVMAGIILVMHRRLPKAYRNPSIAFIFALCIYAAAYIIAMTIDPVLQVTMLGAGLGNLAFYFVVARNERGEYLNIARKEIFNYLDEAIFILDEKNRIVDANKTALKWLEMLGKKLTFVSFDEMIDEFEMEGFLERIPGADNEDVVEVRLTHTDIQQVYELNEIDMLNENGKVKGRFVTLEDTTRNSLFIDRLEIDAGIDPLTGLQNRYNYEELVVELNKQENLPISVIVGDVNSLKHINDTYGHMAGDTLLSSVGNVISDCCPTNGHAARVGGDEFIIMIPKCSEEEAAKVIGDIRESLAKIKHLPFEIVMALGSVTKTSLEGSLKHQVNEADRVMYDNKTRYKRGGNDK